MLRRLSDPHPLPALPAKPNPALQGYGDVTPVTPAEQLVVVAFQAFAVFYFGWGLIGC